MQIPAHLRGAAIWPNGKRPVMEKQPTDDESKEFPLASMHRPGPQTTAAIAGLFAKSHSERSINFTYGTDLYSSTKAPTRAPTIAIRACLSCPLGTSRRHRRLQMVELLSYLGA